MRKIMTFGITTAFVLVAVGAWATTMTRKGSTEMAAAQASMNPLQMMITMKDQMKHMSFDQYEAF
jgi:hypothetical protein